jgi:hypothetical protein
MQATGVATTFTANITFSESVVKGAAGNIFVKKAADNTVVQTIDITGSAVSISGANIYFPVSSLALNTGYYIEVASGAFTDIATNAFTGISGNSVWAFTTAANLPNGILGTTYNFNTCSFTLPDGFTAFSKTGAEVWGCTSFGRDPANPAGSTAFESAVQINGFSGGTNVTNEDWFISPYFDLSATNYPLLSFLEPYSF